MENTIEQLKRIIAEKLDLNLRLEQIDADVALLEDGLKLDSLAVVELITLVEEDFGFQFGEEDLNMNSFANLRTLASVIEAHRVAQPA